MRKPIPLFCDNVYNDGSNGDTADTSNIYYNLEKIDKEWFERFTDSVAEHDGSSLILQAGRFISLTTMTLNRKTHGMVFLDLHNDEDLAKKISSEKGGHEEERFMEAFYEISRTYEREFAKFFLVEGFFANESK